MLAKTDYLNNFLSHLKRKGRSNATLIAYRNDIEQLIKFNTIIDIAEYSTSDIKSFLDYLRTSKGLSSKTTSRKLNSIRTFYKYLYSAGLIGSNPALEISHPKNISKPPRILKTIECLALKEASRDNLRLYTMIELLFQTGLRISELSTLSVGDIEKVSNQRYLLHVKNNNRNRTIELNEKAITAIKNYMDNSVRKDLKSSLPLFRTRNNSHINVRNLRTSIDRAISKAQLKNVCVNDLRNTFIVFQLENGMPVSKLAEIVGHKNDSTTFKYLQFLKGKYTPSNDLSIRNL